MFERLVKTWLVAVGGLLFLALSDVSTHPLRPLTDLYFMNDLSILGFIAGAAALWRILQVIVGRPKSALYGFASLSSWAAVEPLRRPGVTVAALAVACGIIAYAGAYLIFDGYVLSRDEAQAVFDAKIFAHGAPLAPVAPEWRSYAAALQPMFMLPVPGGGYWASAYLPVNAVLIAVARAAGDQALMAPAMAAVSVISVFAVARQLWPERPGTAWVAAILLATSSQFLVTAMTPFAMSAHLAFNLVWLWLFLRGGRLGHAGAITVGFLASGLHQMVFHPLFATPFILQLWLERRWSTAILYTAAYATICIFWIAYPSLELTYAGIAVSETRTAVIDRFAAAVGALVGAFDIANIGMMAKNLLRFVTWQNPLTMPLALLGAMAAFRAKGTLRSLAIGFGLTTLAMFVLLPFQGYGWGYRYLHGLLGSASLLAAWRWEQFTVTFATSQKTPARSAFVVVAATSFLALLPIHAWQAHQVVQPYAMADAAIRRSKAQLVLVDGAGTWFDWDLVRNDPYLTNRPITLYLGGAIPGGLNQAQIIALCARYRVAIFDQTDAARFGIRTYAALPGEINRATLPQLRCVGPSGLH